AGGAAVKAAAVAAAVTGASVVAVSHPARVLERNSSSGARTVAVKGSPRPQAPPVAARPLPYEGERPVTRAGRATARRPARHVAAGPAIVASRPKRARKESPT